MPLAERRAVAYRSSSKRQTLYLQCHIVHNSLHRPIYPHTHLHTHPPTNQPTDPPTHLLDHLQSHTCIHLPYHLRELPSHQSPNHTLLHLPNHTYPSAQQTTYLPIYPSGATAHFRRRMPLFGSLILIYTLRHRTERRITMS